MPSEPFDIAIVTDEVSRTLEEALTACEAWGVTRLELREGGQQRFPFFTAEEVQQVEAALRRGCRVTAVSPGILKGHVEDERRLRQELEQVLPQSIERAVQFAAPVLIVFGFERAAGEAGTHRVRVLRAFERVAEQAAAAGLTVAVENEPDFWVDDPAASAALVEELGHPALRLNWDPANLHWGGAMPDYEGFQAVKPYLANLHVKDYYPDDPQAPWRPVGQGATPWRDILAWVAAEADLPHVTLETHCVPLRESSRESLDYLRGLAGDLAP
jgi:sugar phosphate isomerase/epimerase